MIPDKKHTLEVKELRRKLINDFVTAQNLFTKFENDKNRTPTQKEFKTILDNHFKGIIAQKTDLDLIEFIERFISDSYSRSNEKTSKPISKGTIQTYKQIQNSIIEFSKYKRTKFTFEDIDLDFYIDFNKFLVNEGLQTNTIGKRIALLKTILKDATERGINKNLSFQKKRFKVTREKTDNIYLNESELEEIENLDLTNNSRLDNVRDLFLIGCWTGLRWSDVSKLSIEDIRDNKIEIEMKKTSEYVVIPVLPVTLKILLKYDGKLPRVLSNQKMNKYLKELCQLVDSLNVQTHKKYTKGGQEITKKIKKYERVTTHTARRSFASNMFLRGIPTHYIMKITGHKTESSFMTYIKISPQENANIFMMYFENKNNSRVI